MGMKIKTIYSEIQDDPDMAPWHNAKNRHLFEETLLVTLQDRQLEWKGLEDYDIRAEAELYANEYAARLGVPSLSERIKSLSLRQLELQEQRTKFVMQSMASAYKLGRDSSKSYVGALHRDATIQSQTELDFR